VREKRKEMFFSAGFVMGDPGPLFPHSWTPSFEIARGRVPVREPEGSQGLLHARPEYMEQGGVVLNHMLKVSAPFFAKSTEEGLCFRIYRIGSLEVRTTQEPEGKEVVGAVFSIRNQISNASRVWAQAVEDHEKIARVTEYVERAFDDCTDPASALCCRYYLVPETEKDNKIVTERLGDGHSTWIDNPQDLDDRCSLAKVTRSDTSEIGATVGDVRAYRAKLAEGVAPSSKNYAKAVFVRAVGSKYSGRLISDKDFTGGLRFRATATKEESFKKGRVASQSGPTVTALPGHSNRESLQFQGFKMRTK